MLILLFQVSSLFKLVSCQEYGVQNYEINSWTIINPVSGASPSTICSTYNLFGGYNLFNKNTIIQKDFLSLPNHFEISLFFEICVIDWTNQNLNILIDNVNIFSFPFPIGSSSLNARSSPMHMSRYSIGDEGGALKYGDIYLGYYLTKESNMCGGSNTDYCYFMTINILHNSPSFNFKIDVSCSTSCSGYYGILDFVMYISSKTNSNYMCSSNCIFCLPTCQKCPTNYYIENLFCTQDCLYPSYKDTVNFRCVHCDSTCLTCSGALSTNCLSCDSGKYLSNTFECVINCPNTFYKDNVNNKCVQNCPNGYYKNNINYVCQICDVSCFTCSGPTASQCISCSGKYLNNNNECVVSCPLGYYNNINTNICENCHTTCYSCSGPLLTNCISCSGKYLNNNNECVVSCSLGYYNNINTYMCESCHTTCYSCNGPLSTNCMSCSGKYLNNNNECVVSCPLGYYNYINTYMCESCHATCYSCSGPLLTNCISCSGKYLINNNECVVSCPLGYYNNINTYMCESCHATCYSCNGPMSTNCISCYNSFLNANNECIFDCPINYYFNVINYSCESCDSSCLTCSGPNINHCKSCNNYLTNENRCVSKCPEGYYSDDIYHICKNCDAICETCSGPLSTNCVTCMNGELINNICTINEIISCASGYYFYEIEKNCKECYNLCDVCNGPLITNCIKCKNGLFLEDGQCVEQCSKNYWLNLINLNCEKCNFPCYSCDKSSKSNCIDCLEGYMISDFRCIVNKQDNDIKLNNVFFNLETIENPYKFKIKINSINYFNISTIDWYKLFDISVNTMKNEDYEYKLIIDNSEPMIIKLFLTYHVNIEEYNFILITVDDSLINGTKFTKFDEKINLYSNNEKEPINMRNKTSQPNNNNFNWNYGDNPNIIVIKFTHMYSNLENYILNKDLLEISIVDYENPLHYTYEFLIDGSNNNNILLILKLNKRIIGDNHLSLKLKDEILFSLNSMNNSYYLINSHYLIKLFQNYLLSNQEELNINQTASISEISNFASNSIAFIDFIIRPGSSFAIRGLIAADIIQLLKFIDINYPPNVIKIFKQGFSKLIFKNNIVEEDSTYYFPKIYLFYNININIINNSIEEFILCGGLLIFGILINIVYEYIEPDQNFKKGFFNKIFTIIHKIFIWNLVIGYFFLKYLKTSFFTFIGFRFIKIEEIQSYINLIFSIIFLLYIIEFPILIFIISRLYIKSIKQNKIQQENPSTNLKRLKESVDLNSECKTTDSFKLKIDEKSIDSFKLKINEKSNEWNLFGKVPSKVMKTNIKNESIYSFKEIQNSLDEKIDSTTRCNSNSPERKIFELKNLKLNTERKSYQLNKKSIWDVTPIKMMNIDGTNKKLEKNLTKKIFNLVFKFIFFPLVALRFFFGLAVPKRVNDLKKFAILFKNVKNGNGFHNYYFFFELIRYFLLSFGTVIYYGLPLIQIFWIFISNSMFFIFVIIIIKPYKNFFDWIMTIFKEICINLAFISALIISFCDKNNNYDFNFRMNLGWIIVFCNISLMILIFFYSIIFFATKFIFIFRLAKNLGRSTKISPVN